MPEPNQTEITAIRKSIEGFIQARLQEKLEPLEKTLNNAEPGSDAHLSAQEKIDQLKAKFETSVWLESAAKRSSQIKLVTHAIKMTHPEAKGSSVYFESKPNTNDQWLSTATLGPNRAEDVVGNAAALDVYKFLKTPHGKGRLLELALQRDRNFQAALSTDSETAERWASCFSELANLDGIPSSHSMAKQLYWPMPEGGYQLLSPLVSSSLSHAVYLRIQDDRFSEAAKQAREARKADQPNERYIREYPSLMSQQLGGSKPQNISQLNSDRGGTNYLLPSCPPQWQSQSIKAPLHTESIFGPTLSRQRSIRFAISALVGFLKSLSPDQNNVHIRRKRQALTQRVIDEVMLYAYSLQELPAGWSEDSQLAMTERYWLDPELADTDEELASARTSSNWPDEIADRFGSWLMLQLRKAKLEVGSAEQKQWRDELHAELTLLTQSIKEEQHYAE